MAKLAVRYLQLSLNFFHQRIKIGPSHPYPLPRRGVGEGILGRSLALMSQGETCVFQQGPVAATRIQSLLVVRHHQMEGLGESAN